MDLTSKIPNEATFLPKLKEVASYLSVPHEWLLSIMWNESRLNPHAKNSLSGAYGLIQFMPRTLSDLGTSLAEISGLSATRQLDFVKRYFQPYKGKIKDIYDLYAAVFFPLMIGKSDDFILKSTTLSASIVAKQNPIFDINKSGSITKGEFKQYINEHMLSSFPELKKKA